MVARSLLTALLLLTAGLLFLPTTAWAQAADVPAAAPPREPGLDTVSTNNLIKIMQQGGPLMYGTLLCSIVSLVFVFERLISLRRGRVIPEPFVKRILHQLREGQLSREEALELCKENKSPVAMAFAGALRKWGRPSVEVEQGLIDAGERVTTELRRYLRVFSSVSTITPLLGLLGTVFGMISSFNAIASSRALGRPEQLAGGIAEALLNTAFGLGVAIPALVFYWFFVGLVDRRIIEIDSLGQELVEMISAEGLQENAPARTARTRRRETDVSRQAS